MKFAVCLFFLGHFSPLSTNFKICWRQDIDPSFLKVPLSRISSISFVSISKINILCVNIICLGIHKYLKKFPIMEFIIRKLEFSQECEESSFKHISLVEYCMLSYFKHIHTHFFNEILMIPLFYDMNLVVYVFRGGKIS